MNLSKQEFLSVGDSSKYIQDKRKLREEMEVSLAEYLANGSEVKVLPRGQCVTFLSPCFDKSKAELAALAKINKRKTFTYWCDKHGICQYRVKSVSCVRCGAKS